MALAKLPTTRHGFTLYEPDDVRRLLEEAWFGVATVAPGKRPREDFVCAVGTTPAHQPASA